MFMSQQWVAWRLGIGRQTRVLDIGGAGARFERGDVTVVDIAAPGWECASYVPLDVCSQPLPFADKSFDVCICTQTLEDLYNPFLAMQEMQRVARRGYVETPHRGLESSFGVSPEQGSYPGWGHHRWMFEAVSAAKVRVIPKSWQLLRHDALKVVQWRGPCLFEFLWEDRFEVEHVPFMDERGDHWHPLVAEHNDFVDRHRGFLRTLEDFESEPAVAGGAPSAVVSALPAACLQPSPPTSSRPLAV